MASAESLVMAAGGLAFVGSFREADGFPSNGYSVIAATTALTFLAATMRGSVMEGPIKALAALMLLAAAFRYIPSLAGETTKKRKPNG